jgi:hypothetical protein
MTSPRPARKNIIDALHQLELYLPSTTIDVLRQHRELTKRHHPDRFRIPGRKRLATETMKDLNGARQFLLDHLDEYRLTASHWWTEKGCIRCCAMYAESWPTDPRD